MSLFNKGNQPRTLQQKSVRGIKWQISTEILARGVQLITMFVLAHLLLPADFGLIGMALIFTQLAYVLFDMGLSVPLIQKKNLEAKHYQTAFSIFLVLAIIFYLLIFVSAPLVATFFKNDVLTAILRWLGLVFFLFAFRGIPIVRLTKQLRFRALGILQFISVLTYAVVAIFLARWGAGVWSFVVAIIGQEFILTITSLLVLKEWYLPLFSKAALSDLSSFGSTVFITRIIGYLNVNLPNIIIGRWLGKSALGFYSVGYQLIDFPVQRISKNILRVMFPTFSKVQDNQQEFNRFYKETLRGILLVILPIFTGMAIVSPEFVQIFYGINWHPLIPLLQVLTVVGISRSLWTLTSVVFLAKGIPQIELKINIAYFISLLLILMLLYAHGLLAVVIGLAILIFIFMILFLGFSLKNMKYSLKDWLFAVRAPLLSSLIMLVGLLLLRSFVFIQWNLILRLMMTVATGALIYGTAILFLDASLFHFFKKMIRPANHK